MKSVTCFIFFVLGICSPWNTHLTAQTIVAESQYRFQHFTMDDGLPSGYIGSIAQDSLGFVWMQSYFGLCRYDGYNFKVYKTDPNDIKNSLPSRANGPLSNDPSGSLWIEAHTVTDEFPLTKYDVKTDRFTEYKPGINGQIVSTYRFDNDDPIIWFGSRGNGLYRFDLETLKTQNFINHQPDSLVRKKSNMVWGISDRDSCLLLATAQGLWTFDKNTKMFKRPAGASADSALLYHKQIWNIHEADNKHDSHIWLWFDRYILAIDKNFAVLKRLDFPDGVYTNDYVRDQEGVFWFATFENGLYRYDPRDNSFINIQAIPGNNNGLESNRINSIAIDRDQNIWVATPRGASRLQKQWLPFYNFAFNGSIDETTVYRANGKDFLLLSKMENGEGEILISEIFQDRLDSLTFKSLKAFQGIAVHTMLKGKENFWISVYGAGLIRLTINPHTGMIVPQPHELLSHDPTNENTISTNLTTCVWEGADQNLWVGTRGSGLNKINLTVPYGSKGSVTRHKHSDADSSSIRNDIVWNVYPENKFLWVLTGDGIDLMKNGTFEHKLNNIIPVHVFKTKDSVLLFGTADGIYTGVNAHQQDELSLKPLLTVDDVFRIQDDKLGRLWILNTKGIICYDRTIHNMIRFNAKDGFYHTRANNNWYRENHTSKGTMVISDIDGITIFDPASLKINQASTLPALTALKVNNEYAFVQTDGAKMEHFSITNNISVLHELILDHHHNNFTLEFSAMEMTSPEKNIYRHKLEGYDKHWIETDWKNRTATYTNLDAGKYVFKVSASNHHGIWSDQETTLVIQILPPPWKTWWAYSLYTLSFIGILLLWRSYDLKRVKLKNRAEHLSELDHLKSRFFANISHEFRTPITLMLGPLKDLYNGTSKENPKSILGPVIRNGQRLLRLINQLLDLSKVEAGKMKLQTTQLDLVVFLKEIAASYESFAADKNIKYFFYHEVTELMAYIDPEKIEKAIHNILSNAFKFTPDGGEVILYLKTEARNAVISVKDTGIGIPAGELDKVFNRFYQVDSSQTRRYEGTGLGMALAKDLVELHHGKITVESTEGKGTIFTVSIPLGKAHLGKSEITHSATFKTEKEISDEHFPYEGPAVASTGPQITTLAAGHPVVLIVEDNADMRHYIRKTLSEFYHIHEAADGREGFDKAKEILPDLIISDIMMPAMDGYKLCELIKTNEMTSHVPVILLTAKADRQSKLTGLETGADDYLSKPFDADELKLIVRNRIEEKRKMRERFSRDITLEPSQIAVTSLDEKFLQKAIELIETHMEDENFSMEDFSHEAGYSRMQFYRKIKALSGQTPSEFVRTIRLKRAAQMLSKKSDNITQIAYSVGFRSLAYFNKCFKEQYGVTPGQFSATERSNQ